MFQILRIEDQDGNGLYNYGNYDESLACRLNITQDAAEHRPGPSDDGLGWGEYKSGELYGFTSADQLINWMAEINPEDIYQQQGKIVKVTVETIASGRSQCRFKTEHVIARKELSLDEFYNTLY